MKQVAKTRSHAFTLMELIMVLTLIAILLTVATQIFQSSFRLINGSAAMEARAASFDHAMAALRRDVWDCRGFNSTGRELQLVLPDNRRVIWATRDDGALIRSETTTTSPSDVRRWADLPHFQFAGKGTSLTLIVTTKSGDEFIELLAPFLLRENVDEE